MASCYEIYKHFKSIDADQSIDQYCVVADDTFTLRDMVRPFAVNGWETVGGMKKRTSGGMLQIVRRQSDVLEGEG